jgi:hypothetical protein
MSSCEPTLLIRPVEIWAEADCLFAIPLRRGLSYLRLAEQADRNILADIVYEPPPPKAVDPDAC